VKEAAISDMLEIQLSQLAAQRANEPTKAFASQMITDHQKTSNELKSTVQSGKADASVPLDLDSSHQKMLDKLNGLNGADSRSNMIRTRSALIRTPCPCLGGMQKAGTMPR